MSKRGLFLRIAAIAFALLVAASLTVLRAGQAPAGTVAVDADDIGGVVTGAKGPEAGVWVIAETRDTPTRLIKSVVTDDQGRYLVPGPAEGQLRRLGPRLRTGRFAESEGGAGQEPESESRGRAERESGGGLLPGAVLVRAARGPAQDATSRAPDRRATGFLPTSRARANGSARSSTPTAAVAVISWAARRRASFTRATRARKRPRRGRNAFRPGRLAAG